MRRDSRGVPLPTRPAADDIPYTPEDWEEECFAVFAEGRDPGACPSCGRTGFYGPRVGSDGRRSRACRFCGFFQDVAGPPTRAHPSVHGCADWPTVARAKYIWWLAPGEDGYTCPFCDSRVSLQDSAATPPIDDDAHPWWKVPQSRTRFYYSRFWENWPFTKGRVFL